MKEKKKSSFAVLEMVFYIAALMCSHKAAFRVQANMRVSLMRLKRLTVSTSTWLRCSFARRNGNTDMNRNHRWEENSRRWFWFVCALFCGDVSAFRLCDKTCGEGFFQGVAYYALRYAYGSCVAEFLGCFSYEVGF